MFEEHLRTRLPLVEAADFFLRVRGKDKEASNRDLVVALSALPAEERAALLKSATRGMPLPALPATAKGQNMAPVEPPSLTPAAMGQVTKAAADPHDVGKERAHASLSAEFEKEKHHRREGNTGMVGKLLGGAAGAAGMHRYGGGNALATLGGAALGEHLGGQLGRHLGAHADRKAYEKAAAAFKLALDGIEPPALDPQTQAYIAQEQQMQDLQDKNEAQFLRQKLEELRTQQQASDAKAALLEQQQQMSDQQLQQSQAQVQQAIEQATQAQDQSVQQQQAAAAMRMAYQQLRGSVLQLASADPPALSGGSDAAMSAASQAAAPHSAPTQQSGPAGQAPNPGTPVTVAPEGDAQVSRPAAQNEPLFGNAESALRIEQQEPTGDAKVPNKETLASVKFASFKEQLMHQVGEASKGILPHALVGGALGAGGGYLESRGNSDKLNKHIQELEAKPDRGVRGTMDLAQSRARQTIGDFTHSHPVATTLSGALGGAVLGARSGPGLVSLVKRQGQHAKEIGKNIRAMSQGGK